MTYKKIMFGLFLGHEIIVKGILGHYLFRKSLRNQIYTNFLVGKDRKYRKWKITNYNITNAK